MARKSADPRTKDPRKPSLIRQLIVCAVALCIMSLGILSLWNDMAPYHPEGFSGAPVAEEEAVSRDRSGMSPLTD